MNPFMISSCAWFCLAALACWPLAASAQQNSEHQQENLPPAQASQVLAALEQELSRSMKQLAQKASVPPYFIGYRVTETQQISIGGAYGAISWVTNDLSRWLDVEVRVGDYRQDSSHRLKGDRGFFDFEFPVLGSLPIEDDVDSIRSILWLATDRNYKKAVEKLSEIKKGKTLQVKEDDDSDDFSREKPSAFIGPLARQQLDLETWKKNVKAYSALLMTRPEIYDSRVSLDVISENKYLVNSEGARLQHGRNFVRLNLWAQTMAEDGMELVRFETLDGSTTGDLPGIEKVGQAIEIMIKDLLALRQAPVMDPYTGPAIMTGRAAAVFFHEIFGHRIEGHRQKDEQEGQTFTKQVGEKILPDFISVTDDPTLARFANLDLRGKYLFDDQGVAAEKVTVVENGVLKNFLMSRSPIKGFGRSNGHGRAAPGFSPVARQGNLMVTSSRPVPESKLRQMLIEESRKQGKPYGLLFTDVEGGFTFTGRGFPQAFDVSPILVYRVFTDGRADELVRGVELIGTPLTSFSKILATGDQAQVFNGTCGAESGWVPVSGISPSVLTGQIEVQKMEKASQRPPLLPPPGRKTL